MSAIMLGLARTNVFAVRVQCNYWQGKSHRKKVRMSAIMLGLARTNVFAVRVQCNYWQGNIHTGKK